MELIHFTFSFLVYILLAIGLVGAALHSPGNGTDLSHPVSLIKCKNQTRCIEPYLQLTREYKVYYCNKVGYGVRFYYLVREGLLHHPNIVLVDDPDDADVIVLLPESSPWSKSECSRMELRAKTVVLDETDGPDLFELPQQSHGGVRDWLLYFKRSFVRRRDGEFLGFMPYLLKHSGVLPMTYTIADAYVRPQFKFLKMRDMEVVTTLRGHSRDPTRLRIRGWIEEYCKSRGIVDKCIIGQVNHASRTVVSGSYLDSMYRGKIVVTSNPSGWEGDFRLMEAIASGAMIMVDTMHVPRPYPLIHGEHLIYYDDANRTDLYSKLDQYRSKQESSRRIAISGYLHCMKFHRAVNLIDYIFRTIHLKQMKQASVETHHTFYTGTGFHMRRKAVTFDANVHDVNAWL